MLITRGLGTLYSNDPDDLREGVPNAHGELGTIELTDAGNIALGVGIGVGGTEVVGTRTDADPDNVLIENGTYGDPNAPIVPHWYKADSAKYKRDELFGVDNVSETGTLDNSIVEIILQDTSLIEDSFVNSKVYVDAIGLKLIFNTGVDLTAATALTVLVKKPDNSNVEWTASAALYNDAFTRVLYTTKALDLSQSGMYEFQPKIVFAGKTSIGSTGRLTVYKRFS